MANKMTNMEALNTIAQVLDAKLAEDKSYGEVPEEEVNAVTEARAWVEKKIAQEIRRKEYQATHPAKKKVDPEVEARRAKVEAVLTDEPKTAKELAEMCELTPAQVNGALRGLVSQGRATAHENGTKAKSYTLPVAEAAE